MGVYTSMLAAGFFLFVAGLALAVLVGNRTIATLRATVPLDPGACPPVTIVVAARNEAPHVGAALASLAAQDYPALEIVFVNDRSDDDTGARAEAVASADPRIRVVHIRELPPGWLGKNHALQTGAAEAHGDFLLFADADVVLAPSALRKAMRLATAHRLDLLAVAPRIVVPGYWLAAMLGGFFTFFTIYVQPALARVRWSGCYVGIGAFNLVRTSAYRAIGGHTSLRLRPDDDLMLGRQMRAAGRRLDMAWGLDEVEVEWYRSFSEMMRGLEKNTFAGLNYSIIATLASIAAMVVVNAGPIVGALADDVPSRRWWLATLALLVVLGGDCARRVGLPRSSGLWLPVAAFVQGFLFLRGMWLAHRRGGIVWRGTHYPLAALKANRMPRGTRG